MSQVVRYDDVAKELDDRTITIDLIYDGIIRFIIGLSKKVLIANSIGALWTAVKSTDISQVSVVSSWLGILAFTFQIYFDFSGYSDMAIGLALLLGFRFPVNFDSPYQSATITEFWRRWHISLSSWLKDYLYISLGGNRKGRVCEPDADDAVGRAVARSGRPIHPVGGAARSRAGRS